MIKVKKCLGILLNVVCSICVIWLLYYNFGLAITALALILYLTKEPEIEL